VNFKLWTLIFPRRTSYLRTLLVLARASNLPTVWSNCLAGWILGGAGRWIEFFWLCLGASLLYTGGMFLNDAFDSNFDRQHRRQRPIPSGAISEREVWWAGIILLALGGAALFWMGRSTVLLTLVLITCILIYDAIHKAVAFSPVLMAACRFFLYLVAASVSYNGVTGLAVWSGLALAAYIIGLSYLARKETSRGALQNWPSYFLAAPILLAFLVNNGAHRHVSLLISILVAAWILWCLRHTFWKAQRNIGTTVSLLLAGIPLVDWLALGGGSILLSVLMILFFFLALLFQRFVPAT
jgi:4-hydroxybenzoate polyprenyltransferase